MTKQKDILRINLIVPKSWEELSQEQLKYYYFVLTMSQSAAEVKTYCLCRWSGLEVLYPYGAGRETPRGNPGDIGLAKSSRASRTLSQTGLNSAEVLPRTALRKRKRRRWFSRKYYASSCDRKNSTRRTSAGRSAAL